MNIWMNSGRVLILLNDHIIMFVNIFGVFCSSKLRYRRTVMTRATRMRCLDSSAWWTSQRDRWEIHNTNNANTNISWIINLGIWNVQKRLHYQSCLCSCLVFWWQFVLCVEQGVECLEKLKDMIMEQCVNSSSPDVQERFEQLLSGNGHSVGLLLSERFVNVPPQIALPMHKQLQ